MDTQAPYHVSFVAVPPAELAVATTPLETAVQALVTRLRLTATAAGLPDFSLTTITTLRGPGHRALYALSASTALLDWHQAPVAVQAATLEEAEIRFLEALAEYAYHRLDQVHEQEPRLFGNQQLASDLALAEAA